jgi:hypothetical protein
MSESFLDEQKRLLEPAAFDFILNGELKRAVRSQNFLTLVTLEATREWEGMSVTADEGTLEGVADIIRHEVRDTDVLGYLDGGLLSLVLLEANYENSTKVIDRLIQRMEHYDFPTPLRISVGAACYPTHAVDAESLKREAISHPVVSWRSGPASKAAEDHHA